MTTSKNKQTISEYELINGIQVGAMIVIKGKFYQFIGIAKMKTDNCFHSEVFYIVQNINSTFKTALDSYTLIDKVIPLN